MRMLVLLMLFILTSCEGKTNLPPEMPNDVRMSFGENGGMSPYFVDIEIEGDTITYKAKLPQNEQKEIFWIAKISVEDKTNLYKLFVENKFDQIKNEKNKTITYDAGSEGVNLSFSNASYSVSYGENAPLSAKNQARYRAIAAEFRKLAKKYESMTEKSIETSLEDAKEQAFEIFEKIFTPVPEKTMFRAKFTPFFPTDWSEAKQTNWVSYVYASGMEIALNDGERVAKPFAKITYNPATNKAVLEKMSAKLISGDIQGVKPVSKEITDIFQSGKDVEEILLKTKSFSELSAADSQKVIAYYQTWMKYNGVIYQDVSENHNDFHKWIYAEKSATSISLFNNEFIIFNFDSTKHSWIFKEGKSVGLTNNEVTELNDLIKKSVIDHNSTKQPKLVLTEYKFQYIPIQNSNNEKLVWVNAFCGQEDNWKTEVVFVKDGGKCYWQTNVNLTNKKVEMLSVNGEA